jgi:DNA ligase-1
MIKDLDSPYIFGRGYEVMKLKAFFDSDCEVVRIEEGLGKYVGMCGSIVVDFKGVQVGIGSGLSDEQRKAIWNNPEAYIGRIVEVRYQEITPDGSLRFPTFVCWRNDKD